MWPETAWSSGHCQHDTFLNGPAHPPRIGGSVSGDFRLFQKARCGSQYSCMLGGTKHLPSWHSKVRWPEIAMNDGFSFSNVRVIAELQS